MILPDTAFLSVLSLSAEGHRGVFSGRGRGDKTNKVKAEVLKDFVAGFV